MTADATLKPCPGSPNCVSSLAEGEGHAVAPLPFSGPPSAAWEKLRKALSSMPRTTIVMQTDDYLRAEAVSRLWRFVDDIECVLDAEKQVIHVRSASRIGYSDFGVNRKRVEALRSRFV